MAMEGGGEQLAAPAPYPYTLPAAPFMSEDILFCVDVAAETRVEMKTLGSDGRPITRMDAIIQALTLFVNSKHAINPDHRFAFATLGRSFTWGFGMEEGMFCGVFDGHGRNGHFVSKLVRDYLPPLLLSHRNALLAADDSPDTNDTSWVDGEDSPASSSEFFDEWKEACISAFKAMDTDLRHQPDFDCSYSGTTAVTIIKQGKDLIISNLGDSRAVIGTISEKGQLMAVQLTTDLKPNIPKEAERIRKSNGRVFALRDEPNTQRVWLPNENSPGLAMARAFGDFKLKNYGVIGVPQVFYRCLTSRDQFVILATDGVWDVLSNQQVVSIVMSTKNKEETSKAVVDAAVRAWKRKFPSSKVDDCSAACIFLQERRHGMLLTKCQ